jgi:putative ATP-dependent endonuclease of OLD family
MSNQVILLSTGGNKTKFTDLSGIGTPEFFKKVPGYDTLRLVISRCTILVEGASDELVVQKSYITTHNGKLPIADGIDIISVGTSFLRFLEIASRLNKCVAVITDNDGDIIALECKYSEYIGDNTKKNIMIAYDKNNRTPSESIIINYNYNTLENLMLDANGLDKMNAILNTKYKNEDKLRIHMKNNKTDCALSIFQYDGTINFHDYIQKAINHVSQ